MRLHQVLTGAANVTEDSVAVGHGCVSGYPFTVYGSGYEVVVLDSHFNRTQIISSFEVSITSIVKCIACSNNGKIAASFGEKVIIYQPYVATTLTDTKLPFQWKKTTIICSESEVRRLCWDHEGKRLLVGSESLHIWRQEVYPTTEQDNETDDTETWRCVWHRKLSAPANFLEFSPDGHYFASAAQNDCMVKIWFRVSKVHHTGHHHLHRQHSDHSSLIEERYNFIYILHPKPIQSFSWRKISKHMPLSCVPNVLLTSCVDNICRVWSETVKYKPSHHNNERKHVHTEKVDGNAKTEQHVPDERLHHQRYHLVSMFHFHLAAVINPSMDIALLSTIPTSSIFGRCFQLEWLNNKEVQFTTAVEAMFATLQNNTDRDRSDEEMSNETDPFLLVNGIDGTDFEDYQQMNDSDKYLNRTLEEDEADIDIDYTGKTDPKLEIPHPDLDNNLTKDLVTHGIPNSYKGQLNNLLHDWCSASDTLYCIHPVDGSLLIWVIDYLDDFSNAYYRQVQVSFASRIPATFSKADASSLCLTKAYHYTQPVQKSIGHVPNIDSFFLKNASKYTSSRSNRKTYKNDKLSVLQVSYLVSVHADGSLNLWLITFSDSGSFTGIASITHITRNCGPRFETTQLLCHPTLPLVIGTSRRTQNSLCSNNDCDKDNSTFYQNINDIESELILWNTSYVSPLSEFKGVTEMARISSPQTSEFQLISWMPALFNHSLVSITNDSIELIPDTTCACFVSVSESGLQLYQVLLDTKHFLSNLSHQGTSKHQVLSEFIESEQSGSQSACIMKICLLEDSVILSNIQFLKVYSASSFSDKDTDEKSDDKDTYFVVAISYKENVGTYLNMWEILINFNQKYNVDLSPQSPKSVYCDLSPLEPNPINITHCLNQKFVYWKLFIPKPKKIKFFSSAVDISSSNLIPACPLPFNFLTTLDSNEIQFWNITLNKNTETNKNNEIMVHEALCIPNISKSESESIIGISCASTDKIAYVVKLTKDEKTKFRLVVKESSSTGEFVWNEECNVPILIKDYDKNAVTKLSWLSLENGSYILAVTLSNVVFIYYKTRIHNINNIKHTNNKTTWEVLKTLKLSINENMLRITTILWSKCGFFMIGVENEIQVYSQWEDNQEIVFRKSNMQATPLKADGNIPEHHVILTKNSFTEACEAVHILPQYHPEHLLQLLNLGKMRRVRAILKYLVVCLVGEKALDSAHNTSGRTRARTLTRTYSNLSEYGSLSHSPAEVKIAEPVDTGKNIDVIPPMLLTTCIDADQDESGVMHNKADNDNKEGSLNRSAVFYGTREAKLLADHLAKKQLPGLSSQEQMYLLALSDTVASTSFDIEKGEKNTKVSIENKSEMVLSSFNSGGGGYANTAATGGTCGTETFDDCGLRFLLLIRHHTALLKSVSLENKVVLEEKGMAPAEYCWAFHSDCTEELLAMIPCMANNEPMWNELRAHGVGWWVKSNDILKRMVEKVAKAHFHLKKDPLDCAIFYLAMKKKTLVCALYRSLRDTKMTTFFNNDFTQERWRKAALKNAYALLGKQRFEHAAAFFLLANSLWDAVQVCIERLKDIQLALLITRLYDNGFTPTHNMVLQKYFLEDAGGVTDNIQKDPFWQSMAYWILKDYNNSFKVLLSPILQEEKSRDDYDYPAIFNFYNYLSKHPLLKRRHLTQHSSVKQNIYNTSDTMLSIQNDENISLQERKLVFRTAYAYLNAGLPDIAFEVLCMMPNDSNNDKDISKDEATSIDSTNDNSTKQEDMIITGTISNDFMSFGSSNNWSSSDYGIGQSNQFADLDEEYKIEISLSDADSESDSEDYKSAQTTPQKKVQSQPTDKPIDQSVDSDSHSNSDDLEEETNSDSVSISLKYICIVLCIIEELKALPYKCIQDKSKLRTSLNTLLKAELNLLHLHCDFGSKHVGSDNSLNTTVVQSDFQDFNRPVRSISTLSTGSFDVSMDELTLSEKVEHVTMHAEWLKQNQKVLTSLYEHCSMVGTGETDLPAICLELLLLLHEIEDHRVLTSPLHSISAGPSAPPLLLASMSSFALVASPSSYLHSMAQDILQTVVDLPTLPSPENPVTRLADLEKLMFSLSSCIYHSLCGGDDDHLLASIRKGETELVGKQMKDGKLIRLPYAATDIELDVTSSPASWPGVKFFLSILTANKKNGSHCIRLLLCEAAVAIYLSMFVSACSRLSCNNLYRFIMNGLTEDMWSIVFGGGTKIVVPAPPDITTLSPPRSSDPNTQRKESTRMRWNYKLLGNKQQQSPQAVKSSSGDDSDNKKLLRHELFISPQMSLCDHLLSKPETRTTFHYDSDSNDSDSDDEDVFGFDSDNEHEDDGLDDTIFKKRAEKLEERKKQEEKLTEHFDSKCYAWLIMKLALVKIASSNIDRFLTMAGLEISDLPTQSPLLYNATKILLRWEQLIHARLEAHPELEESLIEYASTSDGGVVRGGVALQKMKALLDPENTPFSKLSKKSLPAKRLWHTLVQQESLRHLFMHYAFKSASYAAADETDFEVICGKVLHKDLDPVTSFCLNKSNMNFIAVSTVHEIIEYDISTSLDNDIYGLDSLAEMQTEIRDTKSDNNSTSQHRTRTSSTPTVIQRRTCTGIRRMDSHPTLPYYVTGGTDGSVRMWEFIHPDQIMQFRGAGQNERVNKVQFNTLGNKFAVCDDSGYLSLWLIANTQDTAPFWTFRCHTKFCLDFAFLGSSSLIATVGFTNDKRNVCIWDTLLPPKKYLVHSFSHNLYGAQSVLYVPGQQTLISGGKRGDVCIFDIRQRRLLHTFQAHDSLIKTMTLDPTEMFFATGSVDGDIKVWGLIVHDLFESFPKEHTRGTVSLRQVSPGVQGLYAFDSCQLMSCGGDGTLKWRVLKIKSPI